MEQLTSYFDGTSHWTWWIIALVLFLLELAVPGIFFLWLGIAAAITGLVALIVTDLSWQLAVSLFTVLSVGAAIIGPRVWRPRDIATEDATLNQRGAQYVGQVFVLETAIENGSGRVKIGDGAWLVTGPDLPEGARVRVTGVHGARLVVEAA